MNVNNMTCKNCQAYFSEYYDQAEDHNILKHIEAHLNECAVCYAEYTEFAALLDEMRELPKEENEKPPYDFMPQLLKYVNENKGRVQISARRKKTTWQKFSTAAAAVAVLAASFIWVMTFFDFGSGAPYPIPPISIAPADGYIGIAPMDGYIDIAPTDIDIGDFPGARMMDLPFDPIDNELEEPTTEPRGIALPIAASVIAVVFLGIAFFTNKSTNVKD